MKLTTFRLNCASASYGLKRDADKEAAIAAKVEAARRF